MKRRKFKRKELDVKELGAIIERARAALSKEDHQTLVAAVDTLAFLTQELETKGTSIRRLRRLLFGATTEKTSRVSGKKTKAGTAASGKQDKKKRKGHGRNAAAAYRGADKVTVRHPSLAHASRCPACDRGKVYRQSEPAALVRVMGMAPLRATVYELERLRCNLCGKVFTADAPEGVSGPKYDETAASMIGLLKYGCGLPFNRLERLEGSLGIPLPAATQWEVVRDAVTALAPAYGELIRQAAQGDVLYNDDTTAKILELGVGPREGDEGSDERTGVFTSGIVSTHGDRKIALFFTGRQHAGENLADVLAQRAKQLPPPIQMCDMLSRNVPGEFKTILAGCMSHSRRKYVEVADNFPDQCRHVIEELAEVYKHDAITRKQEMTADQRLRFHQSESKPVMDELEKWITKQTKEKTVEPNSGLGEAFGFMLKHWEKLTLFLREPGAPLDNNICERILKKAILHRKNSLFFKTQNGAHVADVFMTLIHTAELEGVDPFDYLVALQRHTDEVLRCPAEWMPWNYQEALSRLSSGPDPPQ